MTYQGIIDRVMSNLGYAVDNIMPKDISKLKLDLFDVVTNILRQSESLKTLKEYSTAEADTGLGFGEEAFGDAAFGGIETINSIDMESDFYAPLEVTFKNSDGVAIVGKELQYEEFMRWNPITEPTTTSFNDIVTDATPQEIYYSEENLKYDGSVGYCFTDTVPQKLIWKPAFVGTIQIYYTKINNDASIILSSSPEMHFAFHEAVVHGVTLKWLLRLLPTAKSDIMLFAYRDMVANHRKDYEKYLADFAGWSNRQTETPIVSGFGFLNDPSAYISRGF